VAGLWLAVGTSDHESDLISGNVREGTLRDVFLKGRGGEKATKTPLKTAPRIGIDFSIRRQSESQGLLVRPPTVFYIAILRTVFHGRGRTPGYGKPEGPPWGPISA